MSGSASLPPEAAPTTTVHHHVWRALSVLGCKSGYAGVFDHVDHDNYNHVGEFSCDALEVCVNLDRCGREDDGDEYGNNDADWFGCGFVGASYDEWRGWWKGYLG